jgi:hypothetical protein
MYHCRILEKLCYPVQAHISDDYIHCKLNQLVDITDSNAGKPLNSVIFIKDKMVDKKNMYRQVSEILWSHIQSLGNEDKESFVFFKKWLISKESK